jgi:hypothetical protein
MPIGSMADSLQDEECGWSVDLSAGEGSTR